MDLRIPRRLLVALTAMLLLLAPGLAAADVDVDGDDLLPPTLGTVSIAPGTLDVTHAPATVTVTFQARDDMSGLGSATFDLRGPGVTYSSWANPTLTDGTLQDGTFTTTIHIPRHAPSGSYQLNRCYIRDRVDRSNGPTCPPSEPIEIEDRSVDLRPTLSAAPAQAVPGEPLNLTARVSNSGAVAPIAPTLALPVPAGATLVSAPDDCATAGGTVRCALPPGDLEPGETVSRTLAFEVDADAIGSIEASATAASDSPERTPANNTTRLSIPIDEIDEPEEPQAPTGPADLVLDKSASPSVVLPGDTVTYTLTATAKAGWSAATGTVITDRLPDGVAFADATEGCTHTAGTVRCELGTIAAGGSKSVTIEATVDPIPLPADPNSAHQILETKGENHLAVQPRTEQAGTVTCPAGYLATDGGIRLDSVDQGGDLRDVSVPTSHATADGTGWTATLRNDSAGIAQAKVTVACLASASVTGDHRHELVTHDRGVTDQVLPAGSHTVSVECPTGHTAYAPSYAFTEGRGTLVGSTASGDGWAFTVHTPGGATADFGVGCLAPRTTVAAGHVHQLGVEERTDTVTVPAGQTVESTITCADEAKGITASVATAPGLVSRGTDPRAKIRMYRFTNPTDAPLAASVGLTCVDIRTSGEPVVKTITNTAAATTTATDPLPANNNDSAGVTAYGDGWATIPGGTATVAKVAGKAVVTAGVRCASDCAVTARLVAVGKVRGTGIRAGATLGTASSSFTTGPAAALPVAATGPASKALLRGRVTRAELVVTTSDGATSSRVVTLHR